ncbi:Phosphatidate cytidylyltransferase, mitochondrial [Smittium mucronatum]|uniref:Phosphatidate cytidylyltransferase, mitochondrial n=1 Tax=Smittium mucronatum TaxID=133383 RepID=A0A1R0H2L2_9FUNG|nr:Phosphatidate cytidylyltransferase, mitochondrial [Smittium mucronatum]
MFFYKVSLLSSANSTVRSYSLVNSQRSRILSAFYSAKISPDSASASTPPDPSVLLAKPKLVPQKLNPDIQSVTPIVPSNPGNYSSQASLDTFNSTYSVLENKASLSPKVDFSPSQSTLDSTPFLTPRSQDLSTSSQVVQEARKRLQKSLLANFDAPIKYAFAYGSGVFPQNPSSNPLDKSNFGSGNMVDMIFAVSHPQHWHSINISQNPSHYSFLKYFGSGAINYLQQNVGAGIYYNPFVKIDGVTVKYGVISLDALVDDLLSWESCYVAGRMHKPTLSIIDNNYVRLCARANLATAARLALLQLPSSFSESQFFTKIVGLSYTGDLRFAVGGESPDKISNIVSNQTLRMREMYSEVIEGLDCVHYSQSSSSTIPSMVQDMDPSVRSAQIFLKLPARLKRLIAANFEKHFNLSPGTAANYDLPHSDTPLNIVNSKALPRLVSTSIQQIVKWPSLTQTLKGLLTAGPEKSLEYALLKRSKGKSH